MWTEKLSAGVLRILTPLGPRYLKPSLSQRVYLLWVFRHFEKLQLRPGWRSDVELSWFAAWGFLLNPRVRNHVSQLRSATRPVKFSSTDANRWLMTSAGARYSV